MVQPKYLILGHCGIETLFKKTLVCGKVYLIWKVQLGN